MVFEYTTPELVQAEIRATDAFASTTVPTLDTVNTWIEESSNEVNQVGGRIYGEETYAETFDYKGTDVLVLSNAPLTSVTSVLYSTSKLGSATYALSDTKVEDTDYTVYEDSGEIEILENWSPSDGLKRIQINYTAGYAIIPKTVQMLTTKKVAKRVIDSLMTKDVNEKASGKSVSVGSISIVKPADFGVNQYKALSGDISSLESDLIKGSSLYRLPLNRY